MSLLRTPSRGLAVKPDSNRAAVRTVTEPRDEASGLVFPFGRIRRDGAGRTPSRPPLTPGMPWSPMLKALRRAAFVTVMETTELRDRNDGTLGRVGDRPRDWRVFVQREVGPRAQVVPGVRLQGATQACL